MAGSRQRRQKMTGNSDNELLVKILRQLELLTAEMERLNTTLNTSR